MLGRVLDIGMYLLAEKASINRMNGNLVYPVMGRKGIEKCIKNSQKTLPIYPHY
jgi:hypothetical protein